MQSLTKKQAAEEYLRLERAESSIVSFCGHVDIPGQPLADEGDPDDELYDPKCEEFIPITTGLADHHILLLQEIDKLIDFIAWKHFGDEEAGKRINYERHDRLLVFMPPGSAKSTYGSVVAPAYAMGRLAGLKVILTSYASGICKKQGRKARGLCKSDDYWSVFETELSKESSAADEWALTNGSEFMSNGILAGLTGNRAHFGIFDDPVKGRKDADSEVVRESTYDAYMEDFLTRLLPNGVVMGIQTRWHEDDLSGRILPDDWDGESGRILCKDGKHWMVICLPAICDSQDDPLNREIGETLWPEWFTEEHFSVFKKNIRTWNALFQQKPAPDDGIYFQMDWFGNRYDVKPELKDLNIYMTGDYAVTEEQESSKDPDYTVIGVWGVDSKDDKYLLDWFVGKVDILKIVERFIHFVKKYKPIAHCAEQGTIRRVLEALLRKEMRKQEAHTLLQWSASVGDKSAKARSFQALAQNGEIRLPRNLEQTNNGDIIITHLKKFPAGKHDDAVDMMSELGRMIDGVFEAVTGRSQTDKPQALKPGQVRVKTPW